MDPITTSALIYGGTALAGMAAQGGANYKNRKMMREGQQFEQQMWEQSNQYNSPQAQMERLKQAGLNPNLIYGSGNVSGNTTQATQPKAHVPQVESVMRNTQPFDYMGVLGQYQGYLNNKEQQRVLKTTGDLNAQRLETEKFNTILRQAQGFGLTQDTKFKSMLIDTQKSILTQNLKNLEFDTKAKQFEVENMQPLKRKEVETKLMLMGLDVQIKQKEIELQALRGKGMEQQQKVIQYEIDNMLALKKTILESEASVAQSLSQFNLTKSDKVGWRLGAKIYDKYPNLNKDLTNFAKEYGIIKSKKVEGSW